MKKKYCFIFLGLILYSCASKQAIKKQDATLEARASIVSPMEKCIGFNDDSNVIERCKLLTWGDVPATLEKNKRIAIRIKNHSLFVVPCLPNVPWIGTYNDTSSLIVRCNKNRVRLFWTDPNSPFYDSPTTYPHGSYLRTKAKVYDGDTVQDYIIEGPATGYVSFTIDKEKLSTEELIDKIIDE